MPRVHRAQRARQRAREEQQKREAASEELENASEADEPLIWASLAKGDRIVFTNEDDVIHNVHIFGPGNDDSTDLGLQKPGATLTYKFDKAGAYRVRCNIHPSVKMAVTVK